MVDTDDTRRTMDDGRRTMPGVWHKLPTGELIIVQSISAISSKIILSLGSTTSFTNMNCVCDVTGQNQALVTNCHLPQIQFKQFYTKIKFDILVPNYSGGSSF